MDITELEKGKRAKKMMLWFGIVSLSMTFAGLTSAYVVSGSSRPDWLSDLRLPTAFFISTAVLLLSSFLFWTAKKSIKNQKYKQATLLLWSVFVCGIAFIVLQFSGFSEFVSQGYYFTGSESNVTVSYIYIIAFLHIVHVIAGLLVVLTLIYKHTKRKYTPENTLGIDLGLTFWNFLDLLWLYLIIFFYFYR
ncbi:cytochrome c oxidase subunit 3 [Capnocytophaga canimorsus]|uniref:Oxidase aa(3) subunit 3 n=2 Tax=Capnocytophaga canimorsus TaxID=28188 RepID=F9YPX5_CAPCC|nr:cytochrome c oxidase subunit 3 [Capnocytophaga canimorsus]AEK22220.1 Oxidase aa(3) subunit 3 [Capnocytophaga canimorsus Cc5]ATA92063.1 cytochrome oxidase subunit III [Capnocytophaga canimorsus]AWL78901.1 cytochrome oxidase subunit III [Capnocytophaga canimorsus]AYW37502.1 heme-copper oxidase subunit III [Capnocytophaga canimorsus]MDT9498891.1 cytochrome c oxidase subunit 3 [Capnocytophaga canimorsus]